MYNFDPLLEKQAYEERICWLQSLYHNHPKLKPQSPSSRLSNRLLFALGSGLISLGERMQARHNLPMS